MHDIFFAVGVLVISFATLYILLYLVYRILDLKVDPGISLDAMPSLKPVPIPTKKQKSLLHKLVVFVFNVRKWELAENWHYEIDEETKLILPKGFRFDGASIPKPLWALLSPVGLLLIPGLLHDYGYTYNQIWKLGNDGCPVAYQKGAGKDYWDRLFKDVGNESNGLWLLNLIAWAAIRMGGRERWNEHRENELPPAMPIVTGCV